MLSSDAIIDHPLNDEVKVLMDVTKLSPEQLKQYAAAAKKARTPAAPAIGKARQGLLALAKDGKAVAEISKKSPDL